MVHRLLPAPIASRLTAAVPTAMESGWRMLTPRECARLQGFPDDFVLPSSDSEAYHQVGNAVTVNVVESVMSFLLPYFS